MRGVLLLICFHCLPARQRYPITTVLPNTPSQPKRLTIVAHASHHIFLEERERSNNTSPSTNSISLAIQSIPLLIPLPLIHQRHLLQLPHAPPSIATSTHPLATLPHKPPTAPPFLPTPQLRQSPLPLRPRAPSITLPQPHQQRKPLSQTPQGLLNTRRVHHPADIFGHEPEAEFEVRSCEPEGLERCALGRDGGLLDGAWWGWWGFVVDLLAGVLLCI